MLFDQRDSIDITKIAQQENIKQPKAYNIICNLKALQTNITDIVVKVSNELKDILLYESKVLY